MPALAVQVTDFEIFSGDWLDIRVVVRDQDGVPVDLTDAHVRWWLAKKTWKADRLTEEQADFVLLQKSTHSGSGITFDPTLVDGAMAAFVVRLTTADTEALEGGYYHEAEVVMPDDFVGTVLKGKGKFDADLIRPSGVSSP